MVKSAKSKPKKQTRREKSAQNRSTFRRVRESLKDPRGSHPPVATREITDGDVEVIIEAIADGDTAKGKCRELGVSSGAFFTKILANDEVHSRYARARKSQAHSFVDEIKDDFEKLDTIDTEADGANVELGIVKHKFEARRWLAGKFHVGAYGDRITAVLEGGDRPIKTLDTTVTPAEAMAAYQEELKKLKA